MIEIFKFSGHIMRCYNVKKLKKFEDTIMINEFIAIAVPPSDFGVKPTFNHYITKMFQHKL